MQNPRAWFRPATKNAVRPWRSDVQTEQTPRQSHGKLHQQRVRNSLQRGIFVIPITAPQAGAWQKSLTRSRNGPG
jgi:hypothetical protein